MRKKKLITIANLIRKEGREPGGIKKSGIVKVKHRFHIDLAQALTPLTDINLNTDQVLKLPAKGPRFIRVRYVVTAPIQSGTVKAQITTD